MKRLFVEVTFQEVRFLYWEKVFWEKSAKITFQSIPYKTGAAETTKQLELESLRKVLQDYRLDFLSQTKIPVYLLIPFQKGLSREFRLPWIPKRERDSAVGFYLQHEIPVVADELAYEYQVIEEKEREDLNIQVTAARKDVIASYADCFRRAGYELSGVEYSLSAFGEILGSQQEKRVLCLQELNENRIQLVLYKNAFIKTIREISIDSFDSARYNIYLGLKDYELPVDLIITDGSVQAERVGTLLFESGLAKEHSGTISWALGLGGEKMEEGFKSYALLGEMIRVHSKRNMDFNRLFLRPSKVRTLRLLFGLGLLVFLFFGGLFWYPQIWNFLHIQEEIISLQDRQDKLEFEVEQSTWVEWQRTQESSRNDLERMQKALAQVRDDISLTRLNYKQGALYLWAECPDNNAITTIMGILIAEGWREPVLVDYQYRQQKIIFAVSVKR